MGNNTWSPGDDRKAALEVLDGPTELAQSHVPTMDQEAPVASYQDWKHADTQVIVCRISNDLYPGKRYESRDEAAAATKLAHGRILEANYVPGRAFFRVLKVKA